MPGLRLVILASSFCKIYFLLGLNRLDQETGTIFFLKKKKSKKFSYYIVAPITCEFTQASQGVKLTFFSDSHLAPKFFKVVANSKKVGRHFQRQTKSFFVLSAF